eukprot:Selendium_serpulae@DN11262_c0_g1_i1.p1
MGLTGFLFGRKKESSPPPPPPTIEDALRTSERTIEILHKKIAHQEAMESHHQREAAQFAQNNDKSRAEASLIRVHTARASRRQAVLELAAVTRQCDQLRSAPSHRLTLAALRACDAAQQQVMTAADVEALEAIACRAQEFGSQMQMFDQVMSFVANSEIKTSEVENELEALMVQHTSSLAQPELMAVSCVSTSSKNLSTTTISMSHTCSPAVPLPCNEPLSMTIESSLPAALHCPPRLSSVEPLSVAAECPDSLSFSPASSQSPTDTSNVIKINHNNSMPTSSAAHPHV